MTNYVATAGRPEEARRGRNKPSCESLAAAVGPSAGLPKARATSTVYDMKGNAVRFEPFRAAADVEQSWTTDLAGAPRGVHAVRIDTGRGAMQQTRFLYGD